MAASKRTETCDHADSEDCMICFACGNCSETLDDEEICEDCRQAMKDDAVQEAADRKHKGYDP